MLSVASELGVARPRVRGFPSCHSFSILGDSTLIQNLQRFLQFSEVATVNYCRHEAHHSQPSNRLIQQRTVRCAKKNSALGEFMAGARIKFPNIKSCKPQNPAVFCTAERLLGLYNQESRDKKNC